MIKLNTISWDQERVGQKHSLVVLLAGIFLAFGLSSSAIAGIDTHTFDTPEKLERYRMFIDELRCPKCKNQNLSGSNAPIAEDLRRELHRLITEGETDQGITDFMVARYGDFVLYRPPLQKNTYALWFGPVVMGLLGFVILILLIWRRSKTTQSSSGLTDGEQEQLESFLEQTQANSKQSDKK